VSPDYAVHVTGNIIKQGETIMTLKTAIERFATQMAADGKSLNTIAAYLRDLQTLLEWQGNGEIARVKPETIARFLTSEVVSGKSSITVNRLKTAIRRFFDYLYRAGFIDSNPARLIKSAKTSRPIPQTLSAGDINKLFRSINSGGGEIADRDQVMFQLFYATGIRLSSLVSLNAEDISFKQGVIRIKTKGNGMEAIFLKPELKLILKHYLKANNLTGAEPLFQSGKGKRISARQVQLRFKHWCDQSGIAKASIHTLRRTFATRLYEQTGDLYLVQKALGHRQITTTEIYTKISNDSLKHAVCSLR
jgi:integrase/recombinase XerC